MEFTKEYNLESGLTNGIRTHWTTTIVIGNNLINAYRTINSKLYKISIPLNIEESFSIVLEKIDRLTRIETDMFKELSEIAKRVALESEDE